MAIGAFLEQAYLATVGVLAFAGFYGFALFRHSWRWRRLAEVYAAPDDQRPLKRRWTNMVLEGLSFGWVNYAGITLFGVNREGVFVSLLPGFSLLHEPLFFRYEEISVAPTRWFLQGACAIELRGCPGLRLFTNLATQRWIEQQREELGSFSAPKALSPRNG